MHGHDKVLNWHGNDVIMKKKNIIVSNSHIAMSSTENRLPNELQQCIPMGFYDFSSCP